MRKARFRNPVDRVTRNANVEIAVSTVEGKGSGKKNYVAVYALPAVTVVIIGMELTELGWSAACGAFGEFEVRGHRMMMKRTSREEGWNFAA